MKTCARSRYVSSFFGLFVVSIYIQPTTWGNKKKKKKIKKMKQKRIRYMTGYHLSYTSPLPYARTITVHKIKQPLWYSIPSASFPPGVFSSYRNPESRNGKEKKSAQKVYKKEEITTRSFPEARLITLFAQNVLFSHSVSPVPIFPIPADGFQKQKFPVAFVKKCNYDIVTDS